eukprot:TRINITY_DN108072_c0_g1_i1.p1 TRINITY_DN108072_c0_g1~~TRINITY_DN108072_c0_g1_i1.p1  ORF type:complete len:337 (+),score=58.30 TRINITY_DN108072_c0_g1_i1:70-1080(+)
MSTGYETSQSQETSEEHFSSMTASLSKKRWFQQAWCRVAERATPFFFGTAGVDGVEDTLVEVVRRNPTVATGLLQSIALFSAFGNILSAGISAAFLAMSWESCRQCNRPLRWWILLQAILQICQLPVRLVLLHSLRKVEAAGTSVEDCVASLTSSPAWTMSKRVALAQYGWFVLGIVWWMHTDSCPACPSITRLMAAVMMLSAARAIVALAIFKAFFWRETENAQEAPAVIGATCSQIRHIPMFRYKAADPQESDASCSICLGDFDDGALLRRLPCGHEFHRGCVDRWLKRNKRCPLCMHAIDELCSWATFPAKLRQQDSPRRRKHHDLNQVDQES